MDSNTTLPGGTWLLGDRRVSRFGYGAMQLAGPGVIGPPPDRRAAIAVLREAVALGITHFDTSDAYGPRETNRVIREALAPYPESLLIGTKVGATRDADGGWPTARSAEQLRRQVDDNLESLGVDSLDLVSLRMGDSTGPKEGSLAKPFETLVDLQARGVIARLGLSNVTRAQVSEARAIAPIVCVQNLYNVAHRQDDGLVDELARDGIAFVPFFPLGGGFVPYVSSALERVAARHGASPRAVALAWLLRRSPNLLLIVGTSSLAHLRENVAGAALMLSPADLTELAA